MQTRHLLPGALALMLLTGPAAAMPWRWGVRAGLNGANFAGEFGNIVQPHLRYGLNAGLMGETSIARAFAVHAEVAYSNKGGKGAQTVTDNAGNLVRGSDDTWAYDYIEVPVLLRARLERARGATLFAEVGPSISFAIAGRFKPASPAGAVIDLKDDMKSVDAGFALGTGVEFAAGPGRLGIGARYTRGFSDLYDLTGNAASINQAWTLALSWLR